MRPTALSHPAKRRDLDTTGSITDFEALRSGTTFALGFLESTYTSLAEGPSLFTGVVAQ